MDYLAGLPADQRELLGRVNRQGLERLGSYLATGRAVAFLGAGVSAPLYPLWTPLVGELVEAGVRFGLSDDAAATCRARAARQPDAVVELLRRQLGVDRFRGVLREVFRVRRDPVTGRSWTPTQELVCRCAFRAVVTTNYDTGVVDARMRVRPQATSTAFTSWADEPALDRWSSGDIFTDPDVELPVLYAHGYQARPDEIVLAAPEYRRAYAGKLAPTIASLVRSAHLVWVGFSFADARIAAVLREVAARTGTHVEPGGAPRHVAVMPWNPAPADGSSPDDPETLRTLAEIDYGADLVLYPAPDGDHAALEALLAGFADPSYPPAPLVHSEPAMVRPTPSTMPVGETRSHADRNSGSRVTEASGHDPDTPVPITWVPSVDPAPTFTGRVEELLRLDHWASDPGVRLIGVSAWGGAGKTALVTEWVRRGGYAARDVRGVFGWSFYADPSTEHWADGLLAWARSELGVEVIARPGVVLRPADVVLTLLRHSPVLLVLDGLEVIQEGPVPDGAYGRLLDGVLREVLTGACRVKHAGLVVLTSRFPFADVEGFDGGSARLLEVPPFTPAEGAALLAAQGADWMDEAVREELARDVDGHALALSALANVLAGGTHDVDMQALRTQLVESERTDARVAKVLQFYADRLNEADRWLLAAVALFAHPIGVTELHAVAEHEVFAGRLDGLTENGLLSAATGRLAGLLSWHPRGSTPSTVRSGTVSAHPLVRDAFRPLAMAAAESADKVSSAQESVPDKGATRPRNGSVTTLDDDIGRDLIAQFRDGRALVILGAGVSVAVSDGNPRASWLGLLKDGTARGAQLQAAGPSPDEWRSLIEREIDYGTTEMLLSAAEHITQRLGGSDGGEYRRWLRDSLGTLTPAKPELLYEIGRLGAPIATTNYDTLIEDVLTLPAVTWKDGADIQEVLGGDRRAIVHLHGVWDRPNSVVLGIRSYESILGNATAQALQRAMASVRSLIFIGFGAGLADPNFGALRRWLSNTFPDSSYRHFRLCRRSEVASLREEHRAEERIAIVPYGDEHSDLPLFLAALKRQTSSGVAVPAGSTLERPACIGRDRVLQSLTEITLSTRPPLRATVNGPAGVGKSTVCRAVLSGPEVERIFGDRRWLIRCDGVADPGGLLISIASAVGVAGKPGKDASLREHVATSLQDGRGLLVLDNIETPWANYPQQVESILEDLGATPQLSLLASIRGATRPGGVAWTHSELIPPLGIDDALQVFLSTAGEKMADDAGLAELCESADRVPLALELLARNALSDIDVTTLRRRWDEARVRTLRQLQGNAENLAVAAAVELCLSGSTLTEDGRRLLALIAILPQGVATEDLGTFLLGRSAVAASNLRRAGLAFTEGGRLRALAAVRERVAAELPPAARDLERIIRYYAEVAADEESRLDGDAGLEAAVRLAADAGNLRELTKVARQIGLENHAAVLAQGLDAYAEFAGLGPLGST